VFNQILTLYSIYQESILMLNAAFGTKIWIPWRFLLPLPP
jgi:hypothetical protein